MDGEGIVTIQDDDEPEVAEFDPVFIKVSNIVTPNADGKNDVMTIEGLDNLDAYELMIFTAAGKVVYKTKAYNQDWGANIGNRLLPPGTYYYMLEVPISTESINGFIVVNY